MKRARKKIHPARRRKRKKKIALNVIQKFKNYIKLKKEEKIKEKQLQVEKKKKQISKCKSALGIFILGIELILLFL